MTDSNDNTVASFNITVSQQGSGVENESVASGSTVRDILNARGVSLDTPVMVSGVPTTLDHVLEADDVLVTSKSGKGASDDHEVASFNITVSQQGSGVENESVASGSTVRDILNARGVSLDTPVMVSGVPTTLDHVLEADDVLVTSKSGKGA